MESRVSRGREEISLWIEYSTSSAGIVVSLKRVGGVKIEGAELTLCSCTLVDYSTTLTAEQTL